MLANSTATRRVVRFVAGQNFCRAAMAPFRSRASRGQMGNMNAKTKPSADQDDPLADATARVADGAAARARARTCCVSLASMPPAFASAPRPRRSGTACTAPRAARSIPDARSLVAPGVHVLPRSNASPDTLILRVCPHRAPEEIEKDHWVDTRNRSRGHD